MSNELYHSYDEASNLYALVWRKSDDKIWNSTNSTWDTYTDADIDKYDVPLANHVDSDYHSANFPAGITTSAVTAYRVQIMLRPGALDADADIPVAQGEIFWDGTAEVDIGTTVITNSTVHNVYNEEVTTPPITVINL